jgi:group II intron reverse transcriptase/maturase
MRNAETVLGVIRERGRQELPLEDIYRQLYNPDLYLRAYGKLYANHGAMTPGTTGETVDEMSLAKIEKLVDDLRHERFRWTPVRREYIEKKNSTKKRPLGIPTWTDKLLQEVIRLILDAYYEPQFSTRSHGFRPQRGCHTALTEIAHTWKGTRWFIEGDIAGFFDNIDHDILMSILADKLHDNRFLRLIRNLLQAGYLEDWCYYPTMSGTPQGGVVSPTLANIYLDRLDQYVEQVLIPTYTRGKVRKRNPKYGAILQRSRKARARGALHKAHVLRRQAQRLPALDPNDPNYRRLRYIRYADDFLIGFAGPKAEAEDIKRHLAEFLRTTLKLELSEHKTLITHASTQAARFLGYEIVTQQRDDKLDTNDGRKVNGQVGLRVPATVVTSYCTAFMQHGKPIHRSELVVDDDYTIISQYQAEYRGIVQYYMLAHNVAWLWKLHWFMRASLLRTLMLKHKTTLKPILEKYESTVQVGEYTLKCLKVIVKREEKPPLVAIFGGISLRRQPDVVLTDLNPFRTRRYERNELITRLLADECELCGSREDVEVHHIRKLADLKVKGRRERPPWTQLMIARRRKTLVVCRDCHVKIHAGQPTRQRSLDMKVLESGVR